jgi:glycosyltransferase involved in cell wall biosynthesis
MLQYIQRDIFPHVHVVPQRFVMADYQPSYPETDKQVPLVVHTPSARGIKGTDHVLKAVERVRANHTLHFKLIYGLAREEALQSIERADIVLDQFILGDRGMAALEAMAMGKPVICYIKPSLAALYPESPIVNATPDTLPDVLETLVGDAQLRRELGEQGRAYMEKHYELRTITNELVRVYEHVINYF